MFTSTTTASSAPAATSRWPTAGSSPGQKITTAQSTIVSINQKLLFYVIFTLIRCYQSEFGTKCAGCNEFVEGEVVTALGKTYHQVIFNVL